MARPIAGTHAVPPASAQVDTRRVPIDNSPMRQSNPWDTDRRPMELTQAAHDCLVLEPKRGAAYWAVSLLLAGAVGPIAGLVYILLEEVQGNADLIIVLFLVVGLLLLSALLLWGFLAWRGFHRWVRFDRCAGLMTVSRRPFGFRQPLQVVRSLPLTDIICVQLLYAGWQSENVEIGEPGTPGSVIYRNDRLYQLNLVVDDGDEPRLNLSSHADAKWMREAGQCIAGFLCVPLIDQLP